MLLKNFSRDDGKTAVKKVLQNYQKNIFSSVPLKKIKPFNPPTYNYKKTNSTAVVFFVCFENFKIGLRPSAVESHLSKVTETFGFCREIQHVHGMFEK